MKTREDFNSSHMACYLTGYLLGGIKTGTSLTAKEALDLLLLVHTKFPFSISEETIAELNALKTEEAQP